MNYMILTIYLRQKDINNVMDVCMLETLKARLSAFERALQENGGDRELESVLLLLRVLYAYVGGESILDLFIPKQGKVPSSAAESECN